MGQEAEWLLADAVDKCRGSFDIANDHWTAEITEERLAGGLKLHSVAADIRQAFSLDIQGRPETVFCISSFVSAPARMATRDGLQFDMTQGQTLAYRPFGMAARFHLEPKKKFRHLGVSATAEGVLAALGGSVPHSLRPFLAEPVERSQAQTVAQPAAMTVLRRAVFASNLTGVLGRLHREAAAWLVLTEILGQFGAATAGRDLTDKEERLVHEARNRLLADLRDPPDLAQLAAELGLSHRRLTAGLRQLYGGGAFELVRDARLDHARAILAGTELTLKEVAWRVGYAHASNFVRAFARRFGEPPRRLLADAKP